MERILVSQTTQKIGENVLLKGWVQALRKQGGLVFAVLRDVSGMVQLIISKEKQEVFEIFNELSLESVIEVEGLVKEEKRAPQGVEIEVTRAAVLSKADPELPIPIVEEKSGGETEMTKRFDWRWIDLRKPEKLQIFNVWTALEKGAREFFARENYTQVYTPNFMNTPSESGAEVFEVQYFENKAYLAQSPQFYKQMAMASGFEKVFMVGPVFRAEPSFTIRHMTEFTGWDFEISFIESHHDVMAAEEKMLVSAFQKVKEDLLPDVAIPTIPFPKITMKEAKEKLAKVGVTSEKEHDLSPEEERELSRIIKEETGHDFVFIVDWHKSVRAFYHMRHEDQEELTKSFDLLYKGIEITTGAQREHRIDILEKQAKEKDMPIETLQNYFNFFRYGCPPHGGVGIGPGRIIMQLLGLPNVKEATFLPRDVKRLTP